MTSEVAYKINSVSLEEQTEFILKYANESTPPLNERVDILAFSRKLKDFATSFEAWKNDGALAGILLAYVNNDETKEAFISYFRIIPEMRGCGIGKQLLNDCFDFCRQRKYKTIALEVAKNNSRAIALYEKIGFQPFREDDISWFMKKDLI